MRNMTEEELTQLVLDGYSNTDNPRLREILLSLIKHLHEFVRDVQLTEPEWIEGIKYITAAGQISDDKRQEVILFSDLLGISSLVNMISAKVPEGATESTVIGPFFLENAPERAWGESVAKREIGDPMIIRGKVTGMNGEPVPNARIDVWQTDANGMYDVQDSNAPEHNLRGYYRTNERGEYLIKTVRPTSYPIPVDGPAGDLVRAAKRHPWRPAHVHAMITADKYQTLITHIFDGEDQYLDSDVVFAVKESLIHDFRMNESEADAKSFGVNAPFLDLEQNFILPKQRVAA
jgi:hydroxyquinol 1,2-dioxygenase